MIQNCFTLIMAVRINRLVWPVILKEAAADYHILYSMRISELSFFPDIKFFFYYELKIKYSCLSGLFIFDVALNKNARCY